MERVCCLHSHILFYTSLITTMQHYIILIVFNNKTNNYSFTFFLCIFHLILKFIEVTFSTYQKR